MNDAKKSAVKHIVQTLIFLLFLSLGAAGIYNVLKWKDTAGPYFSSVEQMYDLPEETVDVVFFGPSVVYNGINPAVFWEQSGIAAFNAGIAGQDRESAYYFVKEFVKKQSPKVVVMCSMLFQIDHYEVQGNVYRNTLSMRNSKNFFDVVGAVVPDNDKTEKNNLWDYYLRWPIIHSRYKEIEKWDFTDVKEYSNCLGYEYYYDGSGLSPNPAYFDKDTVNEISKENKEWVDRLIALSKEEGFELMFVQIPGFLGDGQRADMNGNFKYLEEKGIKYVDLNFCVNEMGYDYIDDMSDGHHPKTSGAYKISEYLCKYMGENFALEDKRGKEGYELFDAAVEVSNHEKLSRKLADCDDLAQMFELMGNGKGFVFSVTLREGSSGIAAETNSVLKEYINGRDIWNYGGTYVFNAGTGTEVLGDNSLAFKLNDNEFFYAKSAVNENGHCDEVHYGAIPCAAENGNFIAIYDTVLDRLVVTRELY